MKRLIFAFIIVVSHQANAKPLDKDAYTTCGILQKNAESIMGARQKSVPINKLMQLTTNVYQESGSSEIMQLMVIEAYRERLHHTPESMMQAAVEFGNNAYLTCLEAYKSL